MTVVVFGGLVVGRVAGDYRLEPIVLDGGNVMALRTPR